MGEAKRIWQHWLGAIVRISHLMKGFIAALAFLFLFALMGMAAPPPLLRNQFTTNTTMNTPSDGYTSVWNDTAKKWSNAPAGASGAITNLNDDQFASETTVASVKDGALFTNIVNRILFRLYGDLFVSTNAFVTNDITVLGTGLVNGGFTNNGPTKLGQVVTVTDDINQTSGQATFLETSTTVLTASGPFTALAGLAAPASTTFTNSGNYMPVAGNTTTNIDWAVRDVHTNKVAIGTTAVACLFSNVTVNRDIRLLFVNVTNDATVDFPDTVVWYGDPVTVLASNSTTEVRFHTLDGKTNGMLVAGGRASSNFVVYAAGTAYTTTTTPAQANFGTTDPVLTINTAGTYLLQSHAGVLYSAATYAGAQTVTVKLRKTSGTAADVANATRTMELPVLTSFTGGDVIAIPPVIYTAAAGDVLEVFASVSATPSAGSVQIDSAEIVAIRLY